jgi:hypothetical protein
VPLPPLALPALLDPVPAVELLVPPVAGLPPEPASPVVPADGVGSASELPGMSSTCAAAQPATHSMQPTTDDRGNIVYVIPDRGAIDHDARSEPPKLVIDGQQRVHYIQNVPTQRLRLAHGARPVRSVQQ